jgi:GH15 family glucan-1,4-alpha-glucosidase
MFRRLEEYGIIGDLNTCALVGVDGSVDWCCLPHIESASVFAALLDDEKGGHFAVRPQGFFDSYQRYVDRTNVLQTVFVSRGGRARLIDFMPVGGVRGIFRKLVCEEGFLDFELSFAPCFDYARAKAEFEFVDGGLSARWKDEELGLFAPCRLEVSGGSARGSFSMREGDVVWVVMRYGEVAPLRVERCEEALRDTIGYWKGWVHSCEPSKCVFKGDWHELVVRSGLVLKLLTHRESGAIYAAPTTSLPEEIGGTRNWDYRFSWIRDASFTVQALYHLGHVGEARDYLKFVMGICRNAEDPSELQVMYGLHGELDLEERELSNLSGYRNSRPVRIGNAAAKQRQLDIYGELVGAVYEATRYGEEVSREVWDFVRRIVDYVCEVWKMRDAGIWEVRGEMQHFVYSKLMCWVAVDRGLKIAEACGFDAPERWRQVAEDIRDAILERGFSERLNSFVQSFESETLDATALLIPITGFLPPDDARVQGTLEAVMKHLTRNGLVFRYHVEDGLHGEEGAFVLCSFWLADALVLCGRVREAEEMFLKLLEHVSPLGLLAEEIDPSTGEQLGNFPQALSHIGLINTALYLGKRRRAG